MRRATFFGCAIFLSACGADSDGPALVQNPPGADSGALGGGNGDVWTHDAGFAPETGPVGVDSGSGAVDAGSADGGVAGDAGGDAAPDLLGEVGQFLTCKPEEINPVLDCVTVTCAMESDPLMLLNCLTTDCLKLVEQVDPRCGDCVLAGIAEDIAGLVTNCVDTSPIFGDGGLKL